MIKYSQEQEYLSRLTFLISLTALIKQSFNVTSVFNLRDQISNSYGSKKFQTFPQLRDTLPCFNQFLSNSYRYFANYEYK